MVYNCGMKVHQTMRVEESIIDALKKQAAKERRSFNNYIEIVLQDVVNKIKSKK